LVSYNGIVKETKEDVMNVTDVINTVGQYKEAFTTATETKKETGFWGTIGGKFGDVVKIAGLPVSGVMHFYTGFKDGNLNEATAGAVQLLVFGASVGIGFFNPALGITVGAFAVDNQDMVLKNGAKFFNGITAIKVNPDNVAAVAAPAIATATAA
jgi:hypothetical protein